MANTKVSNAAAKAALDALTALIDGGAGAGLLRIYDGTQAADPDTAIGAQTLLAELTLSDPAFGAAADDDPGAIATANAITGDSSADASGTATWFRVVDSNGVAILDGDVSASGGGGDLQLDSVSIQAGVQVNVTSWVIRHPES